MRQRGAVAIIVGLSLAVMIGLAGLALDLGRLFVNKTELQSAVDACALAAASQLTCDPAGGACPRQSLQNGEVAGIFAAAKNQRDMQSSSVTVAPSDVRFSTAIAPDSSFQTSGVADVNSKFAMCIADSTGLVPWFMGVMGLGTPNNVSAVAVATLGPSQSFCSGPPIGICSQGGGAPNFGYTPGQWIESTFTGNGNDLSGTSPATFRWIDFTPSAGGNSEIADALAGSGSTCDLKIGDDVRQPGTQQGAKDAYNTRFGLYTGTGGPNAYTPSNAPPARTGYAYPNQTPGSPVINIGTSAFADYQLKHAALVPFISAEYGVTGPGGNIQGTPQGYNVGGNRRTVNVPIIDCTGSPGQLKPILGMSCVLMLNPMSNGANGTIYLEYRNPANAVGSPCPAFGSPGGGGGGPLVPTLVR